MVRTRREAIAARWSRMNDSGDASRLLTERDGVGDVLARVAERLVGLSHWSRPRAAWRASFARPSRCGGRPRRPPARVVGEPRAVSVRRSTRQFCERPRRPDRPSLWFFGHVRCHAADPCAPAGGGERSLPPRAGRHAPRDRVGVERRRDAPVLEPPLVRADRRPAERRVGRGGAQPHPRRRLRGRRRALGRGQRARRVVRGAVSPAHARRAVPGSRRARGAGARRLGRGRAVGRSGHRHRGPAPGRGADAPTTSGSRVSSSRISSGSPSRRATGSCSTPTTTSCGSSASIARRSPPAPCAGTT